MGDMTAGAAGMTVRAGKYSLEETVVTAGAAGMSVQAKNTPKELFKNNLYILLVFSPDSTRGKSLT